MSPVHLRSIDLNLLLPLQALLEERSVTRAARRLHLSQPAASRALERLRALLKDDLLVRSEGKYALTPRGTALQRELEVLLPNLQRLWTGEEFSPERVDSLLRLAMTDYAASVVLPPLVAQCSRAAPGLSLEITSWHEKSHEDLSAAAVDLVFSPLAMPAPLHIQPLFADAFVCLVGEDYSMHRDSFSFDAYLRAKHISIETQPRQQNLIDRLLLEMGKRREVSLRVPYTLPAVRAMESTDLILTLPSRLAGEMPGRYRVRQVAAPAEIRAFHYAMAWHPRLERDALQSWFRTLVKQICLDPAAKVRL